MTGHSTSDTHETQAELLALEKQLHETRPDPGLLARFYHAAVAVRQFAHARDVLSGLQQNEPANHDIRRLYIAICLQMEDFASAMEAIETLVAFSNPEDGLIDSAVTVRGKVGPRTINAGAGDNPSLSLCMVVKNEVSRLGPCLNAVKAIVDEIVVVDTGSQDRTADIARIYGARVYDHQWRDDFSAARNLSLEKAQGDYVLILDADEIIAARDLPRLHALIATPTETARAYSIETRNYTNTANALNWQPNKGQFPVYEAGIGWFPSRKIRLFPRCDDIRFSFPIHELVDPSIQAAGLPIADCPVPVHHYGHLNESTNQSKARVYFDIGMAKLEQLGDNIAALRELAVQAGQLEYWTQALMLWQRLLEVRPDFPEAYVNMAGASWQLGHYEEAIDFASACLRLTPGLKEAHYNLAVSHLLLGRPEKALEILDNLVRRQPDYLAACFMSAAARCVMGDSNGSRAVFRKLKKTPAAPALGLAIQDLIERFKTSGLGQYATSLGQVASWLSDQSPRQTTPEL